MEISKGSPQLSDLQTKRNCTNHKELDLQILSIFKEEQQEDNLSPYVTVASNPHEKDNSDEEEGDVISNMFRSYIVDNPMQKYSSLPLGLHHDALIYDKYNDVEKPSILECLSDSFRWEKYPYVDNDDKADVDSFDITLDINTIPNSYDGQCVFDEYLNEELQTCTLTCNKEHLHDEHEDTSKQ